MTESTLDIAALAAADFEQIQILRDPGLGMLAIVAIHDTRFGPAFGGVRRWCYEDPGAALADALQLAQHMTLKCAVHRVPGGGGKAVLVDTPDLDRRGAYRRLGEFIQEMGGRFYTGPDVGTEAADLREMGAVSEFVALPDGAGDLAEPTALGVFAGIQAVARELDFAELSGVRVMVQGLGGVGWRLCERLAAAGASLLVSDLRSDRVAAAVAEWAAEAVVPAAAHAVDCDIYAPCALGGVIDERTLPELGARAVAGSANNVIASAECGVEMHRRGLLYAPDFVINSGALVHGALFQLTGQAPPSSRIEAIGDLLTQIFSRSTVDDVPPEQVAEGLARQRLVEAPERPFFPAQSN